MNESSKLGISKVKPRRAFTLVEMLVTVAVLIIILGLMVSLARYVRNTSATTLTNDILRRLDKAMEVYIQGNNGMPPVVFPFIEPDQFPPEASLQHTGALNNRSFVSVLKTQNLLKGQFDDISIAYFDEARVRDAWGNPIIFMPTPTNHPEIGMTPKGWYFFSAGPDGKYLSIDDNLYSFERSTTGSR